MEQRRRPDLDDDSDNRATRSAMPIPIWAVFALAALAALALIYAMGLLAPTA
jgi:hypothetical protein